MTRQLISGIALTASLIIAGCSTTSPTSSVETSNILNTTAKGTLSLQFSGDVDDESDVLAKHIFSGAHGDADAVEHIWLTIKEVQIHTAPYGQETEKSSQQTGWQTVATPDARFDFLELVNGLTAPLDLYALPVGHYTQIRLFLETNVEDENGEYPNCVVINGESYPLTIPSVYNSGIKCVRSFFIEEGEVTEICLRFNVLKAIHYSAGNGYMMHPAYQTYKCDLSEDEEEVEDEPVEGGEEEEETDVSDY